MVICNIGTEDNFSNVFKNYNALCGITKNEKGYIVIKALGKRAEALQKICSCIKDAVMTT